MRRCSKLSSGLAATAASRNRRTSPSRGVPATAASAWGGARGGVTGGPAPPPRAPRTAPRYLLPVQLQADDPQRVGAQPQVQQPDVALIPQPVLGGRRGQGGPGGVPGGGPGPAALTRCRSTAVRSRTTS